MTETSTAKTTTTPDAPAADDPRFAFAKVTDAVGTLIEATPSSTITNATPCPEFTVKELLEHLVQVMRRVAAIGNGDHWETVTDTPTDSGWAEDYRAAAHDVMLAWTDPATLETMFEVPWGEFTGAVLMHTYTGELAVHGWDLAHATGADFSIDDDVLHGALFAAQFIPVEGRDDPDMPFGPVVDAGEGASTLDHLAGWMGRNVLA